MFFDDQRASNRKKLTVKVVMTMEGHPAVTTRAIDIGAQGMAIELPTPLNVGQPVLLEFDLFFEGKGVQVKARSKVAYSIFAGGNFKVGFYFVTMDLPALAMIAKYVK